MTINQAARVSLNPATDPYSHDTGLTKNVQTGLTLKLQDPTPGYKLYLPERMFQKGGAFNIDGATILIESDELIATYYPNAPNPSLVHAIYSFQYTPPA